MSHDLGSFTSLLQSFIDNIVTALHVMVTRNDTVRDKFPNFNNQFPFLPETLEPVFQQLQQLKLDKSPFVIISVIGQELLQAGHYGASTQMLEAALKIGTCSLKLRGSVFSALSSAFWGMGNIDKAISYMQKDLQVAKNLGMVNKIHYIYNIFS